jgi:phospholipid/cholesterol/gamma-HCH transport system ATP-binding protein
MTDIAAPTADAVLLADALRDALAVDPDAATRLSYAHTSVAFRIDGEADVVGLKLDTPEPIVDRVAGDPDVEIRLSRAQLEQFVAGELSLSVAIGRGDVATRGDVRRYLQVDPILQALVARTRGLSRRGRLGRDPKPARGDRMDADKVAIRVEGLAKAFGPQKVLDGLTLDIPEGVVAVVLGPSGTGKSVLLQHVIGLMKPDAGHVLVRGEDVAGLKRSKLLELRESIGVMFQDGALLGTMSVYDNVAFPLRQHTDLDESEVREVVLEHLGAVGLIDAADRMPNELSGGMRKRAGLARALAMDPGILLCDEPDSGLDPVRTALLADLLLEQHDRIGGTVLVVTHNIRLAKHVADHISVIWRGRSVASGYTDDVLALDDPFIRQFLAGDTLGPLTMD